MQISIKTEKEIKLMKEAGRRLSFVMTELAKEIRVGIDTLQIDELAERLIREQEGEPAFKGYGDLDNPFPATICASINQEVVHGIPSAQKILNEGDLLKIDIGMKYQGYFVDMARTFPVGQASSQAQKITEVAQKAFWKGVKKLKDGARLSEYSKTVQEYVEREGFTVVKNLVGHGIGENLHEDPQIPNYFEKGFREVVVRSGMTLALEPMINAGTYKTVLAKDGWAYETEDGQLSAHYENTILITKNGFEVLTQ